MNKKETSEIKKNFSDKSGFFIMERVLTGFVDTEKNVRCCKTSSCLTMPAEEHDVYEETLKKVLNTNVGRNFCEYEFPNEAYDKGMPQDILYILLKSELKDDEVCGKFMNHIAENFSHEGPYAVITAYCVYTIRRKNKNDEYADGEDEVYRYLITAFCPADTAKDGFAFDNEENELFRKLNTELIISRSPSEGFLYPVFSNRSTDINHVMCYMKSASKPNISLVENVMGCTYIMSPDSEKASFQGILKSVIGDDLDYMVIKTVNEKIQEVVEENKDDTDRITVDSSALKSIFADIGIPQERVEMTEPVYEKFCGSASLTASNLVEKKTVLSSAGITVNIKPDAADKVHISIVDGRRCLLIDIDDPTIEINGLPVTLD
ncbi:MAG: DUF4317 domain-containing protein [Ruminococcus sp.]|nr:DUF4317 domain-containing protein [Ruminococcus sp.]